MTTTPDVDLDQVLEDRQSVHGEFNDNCQITMDFWHIIENSPNWEHFTDLHKLGLFQVLHKVSRIASGDPNFPDHWNDIAGYATVVVRRLPKDKHQ